METIRIALAEDEELFRKGIMLMLEQAGDFEIMFDVANGKTLMDTLSTQIQLPDIILVDLKMPELNGVEATKLIRERFDSIKLIALSSYYSESYIYNMLRCGAAAFLSKNCDTQTMLHTIRQVHKKGFFYSEDLLQYINRVFRADGMLASSDLDNDFFTRREREILVMICKQLTTTEIAKQLYISPRTVEGHRNNLMTKTGAKNMISLVVFALEKKLVTIEDITNTF